MRQWHLEVRVASFYYHCYVWWNMAEVGRRSIFSNEDFLVLMKLLLSSPSLIAPLLGGENDNTSFRRV